MRKKESERAAKRKVTFLWYLLPVFMGAIGGLIGYFVLRKKDKWMAKRLLMWGMIFTIMSLVFQSLWGTFSATDIAEVTKITQTFP